ncbi:hypothetical protein ANN_20800 [Periplaneta americana]|uniref:Uncharacterized protein n=1 Tax=Periplaneta americana TaxID=6978 RepID=A0ABQ8SEA1_PERAM|nr:hypothetical protein ANN_20800 [Periplaneta americana]
MEDDEEAAKKQSVVDLEELYVWLQQFEDPTIDDSHRRVDIIAINRRTQRAMVLDPTICFERDTNQALQMNGDKRAKYVPCLPYLSEKYGISLYNWDVAGLLFGARGDNAGEMSPGSSTESYAAFARIGLRENPGENLNQATCPDRSCVRAWVGSPFGLWFLPRFSPAVGLKPDGLWRVYGESLASTPLI